MSHGEREVLQGGARVMTCRWCGNPVTVAGGDVEYGRAVHGDGREQCADGEHLAAPIGLALAGSP